MIELADLTPVPYNPRSIDAEALELLAASIREHSAAVQQESGSDLRLASTITVNRQGNRIVGGNQRVQALILLGATHLHPDDVTWVDLYPDSPAEKGLCLALNARDAQGDFRWEDVAALLQEIGADDLDQLSALTGLAEHTIEPLLAADWSPPPLDPDAANSRGEKNRGIPLTKEQRANVEPAIAQVKLEQADATLTDGRCIELICLKLVATPAPADLTGPTF